MFIYNFIEIALNKTKKVVTEMEAAPVVIGASVGAIVVPSSVVPSSVVPSGTVVVASVGGSVGASVGASVDTVVGAFVGVSVGGASVGASVETSPLTTSTSFLAEKSPGKSTFDETETIAKTAMKIVKVDFIFLDFTT